MIVEGRFHGSFLACIIQLLYLCVAVMVASAKSAGFFIRFDQAPLRQSRSNAAIFKYSVIAPDGSYPCNMKNCSILCEVDGHSLRACPAHVVVLKNLTVNHKHHLNLNVTTADGVNKSSSYTWFIDTIPPTATISSNQRYTNAKKVPVDVTFSEACNGGGGFKCFNSSDCDRCIQNRYFHFPLVTQNENFNQNHQTQLRLEKVIISGPAHVDASSLRIIRPNIKYSLDIILSSRITYDLVIKMANSFCTDQAGNSFTRTNGSIFTLHVDRKPVEVDLWTSVPSYELEFNGIPRTVTATNKMEELKFFLDFSSPIINSTEQILDALHPNSGVILPIHNRGHGNRSFAFVLKNVSRTEIITVELQDATLFSRTGTRVSHVAPLTLLYDSTETSVWLSTSSSGVTKDPYINFIVEFTKPVFGFEASKVQAEGGSVTRFEELSKALYSLTVLAESKNVSVIVPAGKVSDISGNLNSASNQLQVKHYLTPAASVALHSFMSAGIVATYIAAAVLSFSSANLEAVGMQASWRTSMGFPEPYTNLHVNTQFFVQLPNSHRSDNILYSLQTSSQGMVGHLQVFALSDLISVNMPVKYSAITQGLRWLIPREKLPWKMKNSPNFYNHSYQAGARHAMRISDISIEFDGAEIIDHFVDFNFFNFSKPLQHGLPFPIDIYPKSNPSLTQKNVAIKNTHYGLTLSSAEYFTYFLRGEPMSVNSVVERLEGYTGWQDLQMNLFWLGVGGGGLTIIHILALLLVRWRFKTSSNRILSFPRFEIVLLILIIPCVSQSSTFVIRGGTTKGILTGAMLLVIPGGLILSACVFIMIAIFSVDFVQYKEVRYIETKETWTTKLWQLFVGRPTTGKWFYREGISSSILRRLGIIFEIRKGPPTFSVLDQNDSNQIPRWTESGQNGIGRMRAISSDDSNEETRGRPSERLLGCARSSYVILDLMRRVGLGILSGVHQSRGTSQSLFALAITLAQFQYLFTLKPYILRGVHVVESVSLLCEAGVFGLAIGISGPNPMEESTAGYLMLAFLCLAFVSQIIYQWHAMIKFLLEFSQPRTNSFKSGLKCATKGLLLPLLPMKYWSRILPGSIPPKAGDGTEIDHERRVVRPVNVSATTATVVPVVSPGFPSLNAPSIMDPTTSEISLYGKNTNDGKRLKGIYLEPKNEMKQLRELARASFSAASKFEGSTSYGFRA